MKAVIINGSHRICGNTGVFTKYLDTVLKEANVESELINLVEHDIEFCNGCLECEDTGECTIKDSFNNIADRLKKADIIIFATPNYFNAPSARFKNFIDRTNSLCNFFNENSKRYASFIVGQTDEESCLDVFRYLRTYSEIMSFIPLTDKPIIRIARCCGDLNINDSLKKEVNELVAKINK